MPRERHSGECVRNTIIQIITQKNRFYEIMIINYYYQHVIMVINIIGLIIIISMVVVKHLLHL